MPRGRPLEEYNYFYGEDGNIYYQDFGPDGVIFRINPSTGEREYLDGHPFADRMRQVRQLRRDHERMGGDPNTFDGGPTDPRNLPPSYFEERQDEYDNWRNSHIEQGYADGRGPEVRNEFIRRFAQDLMGDGRQNTGRLYLEQQGFSDQDIEEIIRIWMETGMTDEYNDMGLNRDQWIERLDREYGESPVFENRADGRGYNPLGDPRLR